MRRALNDTTWVAGSQALSRLLAFAAVALLAHLLSVAELASYLVLIAVSTLLVPLLDFGMWPVVTREASRNPAASRFSFTAAADAARMRLWLPVVLLMLLAWMFGIWAGADLHLLAVVAAIGQAEIDTLSGELTGRRRFRQAAALRVAPGALGLLGVLALPLVGATTATAMLVFAAARALPALAMRPWIPSARSVRAASLRVGIPFALTTGLMLVYINSDLLILSAYALPASTIATYGLTYRVLYGLQIVPASVALGVYPRLASASGAAVSRLTRLSAGASLVLCGAAAALLFVGLERVFALFGSSYADDVAEVRPLLLVILPLAVSQIYVAALQARDLERVGLALIAIAAVINVGGNFGLIPLLGVDGALIATSAAEWWLALAALALAARHNAASLRDLPLVLAGVPVACLAFLDVAGMWVSLAITLWLVLIWGSDAFGLRTAFRAVRRGLRATPADQPMAGDDSMVPGIGPRVRTALSGLTSDSR